MQKIACTALLVAAALLVGCEKKEVGNASSLKSEKENKTVSAPEPPKPKYTEIDWRRDFLSTFEERIPKINDDGVKSYVACFDPGEKKSCGMAFSGRGDGFKKVDYLTPFMTSMAGIGNVVTIIDMHVAAIECGNAVAVISPTFNGDNGWIFMNKVAFMADGNVVYEKESDTGDVKRDNNGRWVHERWGIKLKDEDFQKLQKFSEAKSKIIRITGDKGYFTLGKKEVKIFSDDVVNLLSAVGRLNDALNKGGGPVCSK